MYYRYDTLEYVVTGRVLLSPGARAVRQLLSPIHQLSEGQDAHRLGDRWEGKLAAWRRLHKWRRRRQEQCRFYVTYGWRQHPRRCEYPLQHAPCPNRQLQPRRAPLLLKPSPLSVANAAPPSLPLANTHVSLHALKAKQGQLAKTKSERGCYQTLT